MNRGIYFLIFNALWLLLTWSLDVQNIVAGAIVAFLCTMLIGHLIFENTIKMFNPIRIFWVIYYIPIFLFYLLKASPQNQDLYRIVVFGIAILALCLLLFSLYRVAVSMLGGRRSAAGRAEGNLGRCPNCGAANRSDALYCVGCGQTLSKPETICQDCGASNPLGTLFCARCGKSLSTGVATKAPAAHQCAHCGAAIPTGARFCPACAAPAKPATEEGEDGPDTIPAE